MLYDQLFSKGFEDGGNWFFQAKILEPNYTP